jgi:hypothetical protein
LVRVFYEMGVLSEVEEAKRERLRPSKQVPLSVLKWEKSDMAIVVVVETRGQALRFSEKPTLCPV